MLFIPKQGYVEIEEPLFTEYSPLVPEEFRNKPEIVVVKTKSVSKQDSFLNQGELIVVRMQGVESFLFQNEKVFIVPINFIIGKMIDE